MRLKGEWRVAFSAIAAIAGTGFASGQEIVLFFAQLGWTGWIGIPIASAMFGLLIGMMVYFARRTGADSFSGVFRRRLGKSAGETIDVLYGLLQALTAAIMLMTAGELGALTLPVRYGFIQGMIVALSISLMMNACRLRLLPWTGMIITGSAILFYFCLAIDQRPVRLYMRSETELALEGSIIGAALFALLYACLNGAVAGGIIPVFKDGNINAVRTGMLSGGMMAVLLICADFALMNGGKAICAARLPIVVLAARWGLAGFWLSAAYMFACTAATLTSVTGAIIAQIDEGGRPRRRAMGTIAAVFLLCGAFGTDEILGFGYPLMGWICAGSIALLSYVCGHRKGPVKSIGNDVKL